MLDDRKSEGLKVLTLANEFLANAELEVTQVERKLAGKGERNQHTVDVCRKSANGGFDRMTIMIWTQNEQR